MLYPSRPVHTGAAPVAPAGVLPPHSTRATTAQPGVPEPDSEREELLFEVDAVQQAGFAGVKSGMMGGDLIAQGEKQLAASPVAEYTDFFAHGMGLISHEVPFLMTNHPVTYEAEDRERQLETGMVLSIETTMLHPKRGFIKLEDTIAITDEGYEMFGERGRGWNCSGE